MNIVFFTSGTTSQPKGIVHDFNDLIGNAKAFNKATDLDVYVAGVKKENNDGTYGHTERVAANKQ